MRIKFKSSKNFEVCYDNFFFEVCCERKKRLGIAGIDEKMGSFLLEFIEFAY